MLKGKQIVDTTITQQKLSLVTPIDLQDAATKEYVDLNRSIETNNVSDQNLVANVVTTDGQLATNSTVSLQPIVGTEVLVFVNGKTANVSVAVAGTNGNLADGFFSPDGIYKRLQGTIRKGDSLYWNPSVAYFLDAGDRIDFSYIVSNQENRIIDLVDTSTVTYVPDQYLFDLDGAYGSKATIILDGTSFVVENSGGNFVFDSGDVNGYLHSYTTVGENITITVNATDYVVVWDGRENANTFQKFSIIPT